MTGLNALDYAALSPLLILLMGTLMLLLLESFFPLLAQRFSSLVTACLVGLALLATAISPSSDNPLLTSWVRFDLLAHWTTSFFLIVGLATTLLSTALLQRVPVTRGEYHFLLMTSIIGLMLIGLAADFLTLFLGMETLSISLYILCTYIKKWSYSHEAALKYFVLGSMAAALLVYGIALVYGAIGSTSLNGLLVKYQALSDGSEKVLFLTGAGFITLSLAFKGAVVPFHIWAPDVYDGAPTPVTALMAVGTKAGAFVAFVIVFMLTLPDFHSSWHDAIALLSVTTLIYSNFVALRQRHLRRFFAYSGMSHAGFLLMPLVAGGPEALQALLFYIVIYGCATFGCFAVLMLLDRTNDGGTFDHLRGLYNSSPAAAGVMTLCLLTLAGIPPTAGFLAKLYVFKVAFQAGYQSLVIVGLLAAILSAYYYLRLIGLMFASSPSQTEISSQPVPVWIVAFFAVAGIALLSLHPAVLLQALPYFG